MFLQQHGLLGNPPDEYYSIMIIGDSISRGNSTAVGPTPEVGTVYQWDAGNSNLRMITNTDLLEPPAASAIGSQWPAFGIDFYNNSKRKPVFINCGIGGSHFWNATANISWYTNGTCYSDAITKTNNALTYLHKSKPDIIICILGINDSIQAGYTLDYAFVQSLITRLSSDYPGTRIIMSSPGALAVTTYSNILRLLTVRKYIKQASIDYSNVEVGTAFANYAIWNTTSTLFNADNIHLDYNGNLLLGQKLAYQTLLDTSIDKQTRHIISNYYDTLNATRVSIINTFITGLRSNSLLDEIDALHILSDANGDDRNSCCDFAMLATASTNSASIAYDGITCDGVDDYISVGVQPIIANKAVLTSDFLFGVYVVSSTTAASTVAALFGVREGASNGLLRLIQSATPDLQGYAYGMPPATPALYATDTKFQNTSLYSVGRSSGNALIYKDGTLVTTFAQTSTGPLASPDSMLLCAYNNDGTFAQFLNAKVAVQFLAKGSTFNMSTFYSLLNTFITNWFVNTY